MSEERKALLELVASHGDIRLASERLGIPVHDLTIEMLDSDELAELIKVSIKLQLLDLISNTRIALIASLDDMTGRDIARSLTEILNSFAMLDQTTMPTGNNNTSQAFNNDTSSARERVLSKFTAYAGTTGGTNN